MIRLLLEHGADITLIGKTDGHSVVQSTAHSGLMWLLKDALAAGVDVMHRTKQGGHTALHYAAGSKYAAKDKDPIAVIDLLLKHGADLHDNNGSWGTPLHWAASRGTSATVKHLLSLGAKIDIKTSKGDLPIHDAAPYGNPETFQALLDHGSPYTHLNQKGITPLYQIAERLLPHSEEISREALEKLNMLLKAGQELQPASASGGTFTDLLLSASKNKAKLKPYQVKILTQLLDLGFNPCEQDDKGFSLLHYAAKVNQNEVLEKCIAYADIQLDLQDEYGWTALHYASGHKDGKGAEMLIKAGASTELTSRKIRKFLKVKFERGVTAKEVKKRVK